MRDRLYFHLTQPPKLTPSEHRSVALTGPNSYAYLDLNYDNLVERSKWLRELGAEPIKMMGKSLEPHGLKVDDIFTTFGSELALTSAWPQAVAYPDFVAAIEVRDQVKARKFAEIIAAELGNGPDKPAVVKTEGTTTRWMAPEGLGGVFRPTLALTDRHLIFSIGPIAVDEVIKQFAAKGPNLATKPGSGYEAAFKGVNAPHGALIYVEAATLFERLYSLLKPTLAFQLVGTPSVGKYFDAGKLPQAATISKHLAPIIVSYGTAGQGWLIEGTGTLPFVGVYSLMMPASLFWGYAVSGPGASIPPAMIAQGDIQSIEVMLSTYETDNGAAPSTAQGLNALVTQPTGDPRPTKWKQLMFSIPMDPWGKTYQYRAPGKRSKKPYDIFSNGPDGMPDTPDDIGNWP